MHKTKKGKKKVAKKRPAKPTAPAASPAPVVDATTPQAAPQG